MNRLTAGALLGGAFLFGGCSSSQVTIVNVAGLTTAMDSCSADSGMYVGFVDLIETQFDEPDPAYHPQLVQGSSAQFFPFGTGNSPPAYIELAGFCGSTPTAGQCCSAPLPSIVDAGLAPGQVGTEYVTCLDGQSGASGWASSSDQYGGVIASFWSNGDTLQCSADGGVIGPFTVTVPTPASFDGLNPAVFPWDAGPVTIPRAQDLVLTWGAGSASSNIIVNLESSTTEIACVAPDTGTFVIPSSLLSQFQPGDPGRIGMYRYTGGCAPSANGQVSILVENGVGQGVTYQ